MKLEKKNQEPRDKTKEVRSMKLEKKNQEPRDKTKKS